MVHIYKRATLFYVLVLANLCTYGQGHFRLYLENEFFKFKKKEVRYYTNRIKLEWINPKCKVKFLEKIFHDVNNPTSTTYGWAFGQSIYTASDITVSDIIPGDRPYAGWLYMAFKKFS